MAEPGAGPGGIDSGAKIDTAPKTDATPTVTGGDKQGPKSFDAGKIKALFAGQSNEQALSLLTASNIRGAEQSVSSTPNADQGPNAAGGLPTLESPMIIQPSTPDVHAEQPAGTDQRPTPNELPSAEQLTEPPQQQEQNPVDTGTDVGRGALGRLKDAVKSKFSYKPLNIPAINNLDLRRPPQETPATPAATPPEQTRSALPEATADPTLEDAAIQRAQEKLGTTDTTPPTPQAEAPSAEVSPKPTEPTASTETDGDAAEMTPADRRKNAEARLKQLGANVDGDQRVKDLLDQVEANPDGMQLVEQTLDIITPKEDEVKARAEQTRLTETDVIKMIANGELSKLTEMVNAGLKQNEGKQNTPEDKKFWDSLKLWQKILLILAGAMAGAAVVSTAGGAKMMGSAVSGGNRQ